MHMGIQSTRDGNLFSLVVRHYVRQRICSSLVGMTCLYFIVGFLGSSWIFRPLLCVCRPEKREFVYESSTVRRPKVGVNGE